MEQEMKPHIYPGVLTVMLIYASPSFAIYNGIADTDSTHQYAGLLFYPTTINGVVKNLTCGATLIDIPANIPEKYRRRIAITAGHCIRGFNDDVSERALRVTFIANPGMVMDSTPPARAPIALTNVNDGNSFEGYAWTPLARQITGVGIGAYKDDYAVIVLKTAVLSNVVPQPMPLASVGEVASLMGSPRLLTLTGYGTIVWGNSNSTPIPSTDWNNQLISNTGAGNILGLRQKMTVRMNPISVTGWNIEESMNFALDAGTACNGDSGSGFIDAESPEAPVLVATVSQGDFNCRAVNTSTRIDTAAFRDFLASTINNLEAAK